MKLQLSLHKIQVMLAVAMWRFLKQVKAAGKLHFISLNYVFALIGK